MCMGIVVISREIRGLLKLLNNVSNGSNSSKQPSIVKTRIEPGRCPAGSQQRAHKTISRSLIHKLSSGLAALVDIN